MILVVEDTESIRKLIVTILKNEGYEVAEAKDGSEVLDEIDQINRYELILLDIMMPKLNGLELSRKIREVSQVPIVIISAYSDEKNQVIAYENGVDGYITKPFSKEVLKAIVKRMTDKVNRVTKYGELELDKKGRRVLYSGEEIQLATKERELLFYLEENKGYVKTREQILAAVWGFDFDGNDRVVDKHMTKLREKLSGASTYLKTIKMLGYKFEE